jgi:hypothetical protein
MLSKTLEYRYQRLYKKESNTKLLSLEEAINKFKIEPKELFINNKNNEFYLQKEYGLIYKNTKKLKISSIYTFF